MRQPSLCHAETAGDRIRTTHIDLLLTYDFPPLGGGIARWMEAIAMHHPPGSLVVSTGSMVDAAMIDASFPSLVDRVPTPSARLKTIQGLFGWSRRAARLARDHHVRFAWCGNVRPAIYPAAFARARVGVPFGVIVHGGDLLTLRQRLGGSTLRRTAMRRLLGQASVFVANSSWTRDMCRSVLDELGVQVPVVVVEPGTDPDRLRPDPAAAAAFRSRRSLPDGQWLLTVARLVPHKGIDTTIQAVANLVHAGRAVRYLIVGRGPDEQRLRGLIHQLDVNDNVRLLTDVTDSELPAVYAMGDVYVGLSRATGIEVEGFGISLLEAASAGLAVVAGASGGTSSAVADQVTGYLVDPTDASAATERIASLLSDPEARHTMGQAGRQRVVDRFNWNRVVTDMQALAARHGRS